MSSGLYNMHKADFDKTLDLTKIRPYGDTMNDGKVQMSFTLPVKDDARGEEAARQLAKKMGLEDVNVAYHNALDKEFTMYVVYGSCQHTVNYEDIHVLTVESDTMSMEETDEYIKENAIIIEEILRQRLEGIKNENTSNWRKRNAWTRFVSYSRR